MNGLGQGLAAVLTVTLLATTAADAASRRRAPAPVRKPAAARPAPIPAGPLLDANGLPTFAERAPAPPPSLFSQPLAALEDQVRVTVAARCPAQPLSYTGDEWLLTSFDEAFWSLLNTPASGDAHQIALEAYRRCIDRAIGAIQSSPNYVVANTSDDDCVECDVTWSNLALQVPRLRGLKAMSYLAPVRMADQNPALAVATMRASIADFGIIHTAFQRRAALAFDRKGRVLRREQRDASERARRSANAAAIGAALGTGLGMALGMNAQQSSQAALGIMNEQFAGITSDLAARQEAVAAKQNAIDAEREGLFALPAFAKWSDDGVRVTVPHVIGKQVVGGKIVFRSQLGALNGVFHIPGIVRIVKNGGTCTGAIVGPRLVLTNRHCVVAGDNQTLLSKEGLGVKQLRTRQFDDGPGSEASTFAVMAVHTSSLHEPLTDSADDWAFLEVGKPFGGAGYLPLVDPTRLAEAGEFRVAVAGYSADLNQGSEITMDWGCRARWLKRALFHRCRMWNGASGSPIVAVDDTYPRYMIVGVNAAYFGDERPTGAFEGLRVGAASPGMFQTYEALLTRQKNEK